MAVKLNNGVFLGVEIDPTRIEKRLKTGYIDKMTDSLEEALKWVQAHLESQEPVSIGLVGNAATVYAELVKKRFFPDMVTDQTAAHDALVGYIPEAMTLLEAAQLRQADPDGYVARSMASMAHQVEAMLAFQENGAIVFDYGNNIRTQAHKMGVEDAYDIPGFIPEYIRPLFCEGQGPFRVGRAFGRPGGHLYDGPGAHRSLPRKTGDD